MCQCQREVCLWGVRSLGLDWFGQGKAAERNKAVKGQLFVRLPRKARPEKEEEKRRRRRESGFGCRSEVDQDFKCGYTKSTREKCSVFFCLSESADTRVRNEPK